MFDPRENVLKISLWDTRSEDSEIFSMNFHLTSEEADEVVNGDSWLPRTVVPVIERLHQTGFEISDSYTLNNKVYVLVD